MPLGAESTMGAIAAAFGLDKVKIKRYWRDQAIQQETKSLLGTLENLRASDAIDQAEYERALASIRPQAEKLAEDDVNRLTKALDEYGKIDPVGTYERIREGNLAALGQWAKTLADYGSAADKVTLAARGVGGRPSEGTYGSILRQDRVSRNIAPVVGGIFSRLGPDTGILTSQRSGALADYVNLLRERSSIPYRNVASYLLPGQQRYRTLGEQITALGGLENVSRMNYLGTKAEEGRWGRVLKGLGRGVDQLGDFALDAYMGGTNMSSRSTPASAPFQGGATFTGAGGGPTGSQWPDASGGYNYFNPAYYGPSATRVYRGDNPPLYDIPSTPMPSTSGAQPEIPYSAYFTGYA